MELMWCGEEKYEEEWIQDSEKSLDVEEGTTRGTTALVYLQLHSSLYTGALHVLSSVVGVHPTGLTATRDVGSCPHRKKN